jgi:hypothetical protein
MQYPGTSPYGSFGGAAGASAMTNQLSPVALAARKQALIQALASGANNRPAFPGAGLGAFGGNNMNNFASSFFSNGAPDQNQFYGPNGTGTVGDPMFSAHDPNATGGQLAIGVGGIGAAAPPTTSAPATSGGIVGGLDPTRTVSPDWAGMINQLAGIRSMFSGGSYGGM